MAQTQKDSVVDVLEQELEKSKKSYKVTKHVVVKNGQNSPMSKDVDSMHSPSPIKAKLENADIATGIDNPHPIEEEFHFEDSQELLQDESIKGTPI